MVVPKFNLHEQIAMLWPQQRAATDRPAACSDAAGIKASPGNLAKYSPPGRCSAVVTVALDENVSTSKQKRRREQIECQVFKSAVNNFRQVLN